MNKLLNLKLFYCFLLVSLSTPLTASAVQCGKLLLPSQTSQHPINIQTWSQKVRAYVPLVIQKTKPFAVDKALDIMGYMKGLPKYLKRIKALIESEKYLRYRNFGEMGLAEMGISVRVNQQKLRALDTDRPLIIVANHPLGIADGLSLQYLSSSVRQNNPTLLMLARWIEKLLPSAVFGDERGWGTAIPVDINKPALSDPLYQTKVSEIKSFNSKWSRVTLKELKKGASVIIFPAGQVAGMNADKKTYPHNIQDTPGSWQNGLLNLAKLGRADIVFAQIDSVNSRAFYQKRKRFGGGDKERVVWFFSEALAKKDQTIDVYLSDPLSLDSVYQALSQTFEVPEAELQSNDQLATELMRTLTHDVNSHFPQDLDHIESPRRME
jgi:putative hemolysin